MGFCISCGRFVCSECRAIRQQRSYCVWCADELPEPSPESTTPEPRQATDGNWFARHLNWTAVITWVLWGVIVIFVLPRVQSRVASSLAGMPIGEAAQLAMMYGIAVVFLFVAWIGPTNSWILDKKSRSYGWILLAPLSTILLENKTPRHQVDQPSQVTRFVGDSEARVFHTLSCALVGQMKPEDIVWFGTRDEAEAAGCAPCETCLGD